MTGRCARERDVILAAAREWTALEDADLAVHVAECARCREVTLAAEAVLEQCAAEIRSAEPPSAAIVWWRLERRLREDRARAADRPLSLVHAVAAAVGLAVTLAILQAARPWLSATVLGAAASLGEAWTALADRSATAPHVALPFLLMALALLVLAPTAVYLGLAKEDR